MQMEVHGNQGGRGHWTVNSADTQRSLNPLSYLLTQRLWMLLLNFDRLVPNWQCPNFSTNNTNLEKM